MKDVQGLRIDSEYFTNGVEDLRNVSCKCVVILGNERCAVPIRVVRQVSLENFVIREDSSRIRYISTTIEPHSSNVGDEGESG